MRPNIDIPHEVHGFVKDYAAEKDISISKAYERIIRKVQYLDRMESPKEIEEE